MNSRKILPEYKAFAFIEEDSNDKVGNEIIQEKVEENKEEFN